MPRLARIDSSGVIHYVIIREIEKRAIFRDQADREDFMKRLGALIPRCYASVLMSNHANCLSAQRSMPPGDETDPPQTKIF